MSTRSMIARKNEDGTMSGVYHHSDGYPDGLGETLLKIHSSVFNGRLIAMIDTLITQHPAGWSSIIDADWSQTPGFVEWGSNTKTPDTNQPKCYCHGDRQEEANPFHCLGKDCDGSKCYPLFIEFVWVLTPWGLERWDGMEKSERGVEGYVHQYVQTIPWGTLVPEWVS